MQIISGTSLEIEEAEIALGNLVSKGLVKENTFTSGKKTYTLL